MPFLLLRFLWARKENEEPRSLSVAPTFAFSGGLLRCSAARGRDGCNGLDSVPRGHPTGVSPPLSFAAKAAPTTNPSRRSELAREMVEPKVIPVTPSVGIASLKLPYALSSRIPLRYVQATILRPQTKKPRTGCPGN